MRAWAKPLAGLWEQASYSAGRFLFWVMAPALATDAWDKIALLSLLNLFMMMLYASIIGGPSFYRLVRGQPEEPAGMGALSAYLPCQAVIAALSLIGPCGYILLHPEAARADPGFVALLVVLPWVSSAADWARKTMILLGRQKGQGRRNLLFAGLWLAYAFWLALWPAPVGVEALALVFCGLTAVVYLPISGVGRAAHRGGRAALAPFSVWRQYLVAGGLAYGLGNALFWMAIDSPALQDFVVLRNYLAPVLLLSLYIESYGALQMEAADQKRRLVLRYLLGVGAATIAFSGGAYGVLRFGAGQAVDPVIFGFGAGITFLIAAIKLPTVYLRLRGQEHLVTLVYLMMVPLWPLAFAFGLLGRLPFAGLELLLGQYLVLALGLALAAAAPRLPWPKGVRVE